MERSKRSRRLAFFAIVAALPTALACNAIIGLDEFKRTECGIDPCPPVEGGTDVNQPDTVKPDGQTDGGTDAPPGVSPAVWAEFPMPNHAADAGILTNDPHPLDYDKTNQDFVIDKVTTLVWRRAPVGQSAGGDDFLNVEDARAACTKLDPSTGPWRLPKRIELVTLLAHTQAGTVPFIDQTAFPGVKAVKAWTSSEVRPLNPSAQKYWIVDFEDGNVAQIPQGTIPAKALCVRDKK